MLTACTNMRLPSNVNTNYKILSRQQRKHDLMQITSWQNHGVFSIQHGKDLTIAAFNWRQLDKADYQINIHSTFDIYNVSIIGHLHRVSLWRTRREHYQAHSAEQLIRQQLGWQLPVGKLYYWIRGLAAPGAATKQFDYFNHLIDLQQAGWSIQLSHYVTLGKVDLPQSLLISNKVFRIKIVIKQWQLK